MSNTADPLDLLAAALPFVEDAAAMNDDIARHGVMPPGQEPCSDKLWKLVESIRVALGDRAPIRRYKGGER